MKIFVILISIFLISCQKNEYFTKEILAENVFKSLQESDIELFKKSSPKFELVNRVTNMSQSEYDNWITDNFIQSQEEFTRKNYNPADFEVFKVNEPYRTYEIDSLKIIRYYVIVKNSENVYLKLHFIDCAETPDDGYKIVEPIDIVKSN